MERTLGSVRFVLLFAIAATCLLLWADPRYRDFPVAVFIVPACGYALLRLVGDSHVTVPRAIEENALAFVIAAAAGGIAWQEGWRNGQAMQWCCVCIVYALSIISRRQRSAARASAPA
jgi:glucan 1,3-beta-glucosidase